MADQSGGSINFVIEQFRKYYESRAKSVEAPPKLKQREFGFLYFDSRNMFRHIGFEDVNHLRKHLNSFAPAHTYFSSAYYEDPEASMEHKGWLGADLVFDIDSDHFKIPCQKRHDKWKCKICGNEGKGKPPEKCRKCEKSSFDEESWLCEFCLNAAKYEAQKLLDILIQDFGFSPTKDVSVNFSGNRGYHIHVRSSAVKELDQLARREIVDYIMAIGIEPRYLGFNSPSMKTISRGNGWRSRSIKALYEFIFEATPKTINELELSKNSSKNLIETKETILELLMNASLKGITKYVDAKSMEKLMEAAITKQAAAIDTVVTTDLRRLIRLPNTLHGKTGWLTQSIPINNLEDYNPLMEAIAFTEGTKRVHINEAPEIKIGGITYGPYRSEKVELPLAVAMFLLCRKKARVIR